MMALLQRRLQLYSFGSFSLPIFVLYFLFCWTNQITYGRTLQALQALSFWGAVFLAIKRDEFGS